MTEYTDQRLGKRLGNYQLTDLLGQGSFAKVYLGTHIHLNTLAALKVLRKVHLAEQDLEQFLSEARAIARLVHPHIIRVLDFGVEDGTPFLIMDYAPNGTLRQRHPKESILSPDVVLPYVKQVASALQYAHEQKLIHRDIKPENMLLGRDTEILLSDFGLVITLQSAADDHTQNMAGTIPYMAPEQIRGRAQSASDQYSLGVVVYEWLTGDRPFQGTLFEVMSQHVQAQPPSLRRKVPHISAEIEYVVMRTLAKDPQQRFASVQDFALAFEEACTPHYATIKSSPDNTISSSTHHMMNRTLLENTPVTAHVHWNVPYRRNPFFTGREELLEHLHTQLLSSNSSPVSQSQALTGLGGIGKTQIAVEYAYRYRDAYQAIFWLRASSRETLISDYVALASLLELAEYNAQDQTIPVRAVKRWLETHSGWLLILDNADDLALLHDFLPADGRGHILLTTRSQAKGTIANTVEVEKMAQTESSLLLLRRARLIAADAPLPSAIERDRTIADNLSELLDGLPLALDQAGAYIEETDCGLDGYLKLYQTRRFELLQERGEFVSDHPQPVATTWSLSFEKMEQSNPTAADLLRFFAFLAPDAIPEELIVEGASELGPHLQKIAQDSFTLNAALRELRKFSLVKRDLATKTFFIHRLVQAVLRDKMPDQQLRAWAERTIRAVNKAFPDVTFDSWQRCERCLSHAQATIELIDQFRLYSPEATRLLTQTALYLQERAQYTQAEHLLLHAVTMQQSLAREEPCAIAGTLNKLGWIYFLQAKYDQAEEVYQQALQICEESVGKEHPDIANIFNNLGVLYRTKGKYSQARQFHRQALEIREKTLGPEHTDVAFSLHNLAALYRAQRKYTQANQLLQRALAIQEKQLGPDHPNVAFTLNNLARLYQVENKYREAEEFSRRALSIQERSIGKEHPDTAFTLTTLAALYMLEHRYQEAEPLFLQALKIREKTLGLEHPTVVHILNSLAWLHRDQGQHTQALSLFERVVSIREKILPLDHPEYTQSVLNLAKYYQAQGKYELAEPLYQKMLTMREQAHGLIHPNVAASLNTLARFYSEQEDYQRAEPLYQRALSIYQSSPPSNPVQMTLLLHNYAFLLHRTGRRKEAQGLEAQAKTLQVQPKARQLPSPEH